MSCALSWPFTPPTQGMSAIAPRSSRLVSACVQRGLATASQSLAHDAHGLAGSADRLLRAWSDEATDRRAISSTSALPRIDCLRDVFAVHKALIDSPEATRLGGHVGFKLGWKNHPLLDAGKEFEQGLAAMYSPIFASCFRDTARSGTPAHVSLSRHKVFAAEAEYLHVMAQDLEARGTPYSEAEVWKAVSHVEACIELCGTRTAVLSPELLPLADLFLEGVSPYQLLADAMLNALTIRGPTLALGGAQGSERPPESLTHGAVRLYAEGVEVSAGTGRENPGDSPISSLTFLVNDLTHRRGLRLEAGSIVIAGHTCQCLFPGRPSPRPARALPKAQMARVATPTEPGSLPRAPLPLGPRTSLVAEFDAGANRVEVVLLR